jgi:acyl-CoA reductase-like NAD-dependent aldehyde dehydrogenase
LALAEGGAFACGGRRPVDMPFGGYKQSGLGREMGVAGFEEYLQTKAIATGVQ